MFFTSRLDKEIRYVRARHPEYRWQPQVQCVSRFPFYQTGVALSVLCRCGRQDDPAAKKAFRDLLKLRGPGGEYYTDHWCACNLARWVRTGAPKFGRP